MAAGRQPRRAGFALVEVLVALTLFAVGLVSVLGGILSALDLQKDSALRWRAGLLLEEKLADAFLQQATTGSAQGVSADGVFHWTTTLQAWDGASPARDDKARKGEDTRKSDVKVTTLDLREVAVEVRWETRKGLRRLHASQVVNVPAAAGSAP